jgi:polyhydroxyalkanoate synthesis regulator phasin
LLYFWVVSIVENLQDVAKRAFYLGVGFASYAAERAGVKFLEIQEQAQQMTDELVKRGEATTSEAQQWLNAVAPGMVPPNAPGSSSTNGTSSSKPRQIDILDAEIESESNS